MKHLGTYGIPTSIILGGICEDRMTAEDLGVFAQPRSGSYSALEWFIFKLPQESGAACARIASNDALTRR